MPHNALRDSTRISVDYQPGIKTTTSMLSQLAVKEAVNRTSVASLRPSRLRPINHNINYRSSYINYSLHPNHRPAMDKDSDRRSSDDASSPGHSPLMRDRRNRPFKALTPKRLDHSPGGGACGRNNQTTQHQQQKPKQQQQTSNIRYNQSPGVNHLGGKSLAPNAAFPAIMNKSGIACPKDRVGGHHHYSHTDHYDNKVDAGEQGEDGRENYDAHDHYREENFPEPKRRTRSQLCAYIHKNEFGSDMIYKGPYGCNVMTYLDYTASGRPLKCIETYIQRYVLPTYANTHTEVSDNAIQTTIFREEARDIIRKSVNAGEDDCVVFTGSGVTAAINKLVYILRLEDMGNVIVFIGPYEHHSNILPWVHSSAKVIRIPQDRDGILDIGVLACKLEEVKQASLRRGSRPPFIVGAFSAASNVTGIITPTYPVSCLIHRYDGIVCWDYACAGPYVDIDMNPEKIDPLSNDEPYKDAIVISPHKFLGGPGTPGILVAKSWVFQNQIPHQVGGGTVLFVRRTKHVYTSNPESREEGGTPAIIESIRCGLVFKLKDAVGSKYIMKKEQAILNKAINFLQDVDGLVLLGNSYVHRLPILSFLLYNQHTGRFLHHDFVATLLNDVFGMQVRSGCACAGPYGMDLMGMSEQHAEKFEKLMTIAKRDGSRKPSINFLERETVVFQNGIFKPGFVRLNLPYFVTEDCIDFVLKAVRLVALHGWSLLPQYDCDVEKGGWKHVGSQATVIRRHLDEVSFASGSMTVKRPVTHRSGSNDCESSLSSSASSDTPNTTSRVNYTSILKRAEGLFYDAMSGVYDTATDTTKGINDELMWFMSPKEAADIIHKRKTRARVNPEDLPFMPGGLAVKLGIDPTGHAARGKEMDKKFPVEFYPKGYRQSPMKSVGNEISNVYTGEEESHGHNAYRCSGEEEGLHSNGRLSCEMKGKESARVSGEESGFNSTRPSYDEGEKDLETGKKNSRQSPFVAATKRQQNGGETNRQNGGEPSRHHGGEKNRQNGGEPSKQPGKRVNLDIDKSRIRP